MEVIPWLYAHSKYTRYLSAVVYGSYNMAVVTPQFAHLADSGLRCIYTTGGAFDLYSSHSTNCGSVAKYSRVYIFSLLHSAIQV